MDRDSFPTLTASTTGWPVMNVDLDASTSISIEVSEDHERGGHCVSITTTKGSIERTGGVYILVDGLYLGGVSGCA